MKLTQTQIILSCIVDNDLRIHNNPSTFHRYNSASSGEKSVARNLYRLLIFFVGIIGFFVLACFVFAQYLLSLFVEEFRTLGTRLLELLLITSIPFSGLQYRITRLSLWDQYIIILLVYLIRVIMIRF